MALRDHVTPGTMLSYARAAIAVARACDELGQNGYESMVVPSRGAVPVIRAAQQMADKIMHENSKLRAVRDSMLSALNCHC